MNKMKSKTPTLTKMTRLLSMAFAALLMLGTMASCSSDDTAADNAANEQAYLNLSFSTSSPTITRADDNLASDETKADPTSESDIHSIKVWVFQSDSGDDALPLAYKEDNLSTAANGTYTLSLLFLRQVNGTEVKNIDLYILANSESTDMNFNSKSMKEFTRKDLQELTFNSSFGITSEGKPEATTVPEGKGLPISRAVKNISVKDYVADTEAGAAVNPIKIPLVRAVSKLHFYFARKTNANTEDVKVTKIEIDDNTFPINNFAFPEEEEYSQVEANKNATSNKYNTSSTYFNNILSLGGVETTDIKAVEDPTTYKRGDNEEAQTYINRMNKDLVSQDLCYLHETNKSIKGKIYYQLANGSEEKSAEFTIPSSGNAIRNRELVVYGYFLEGGSLCLDWQVLPWSVQTSEVDWKANCQMYAWTTKNPSATKGDAEGLYCLVCYPRYAENDDNHNSLEDKKSGAAFYIKVDGSTGLIWKAHLTNTEDFEFNYGKSTNSTNCVSTGIARTAPYQIKVQATHQWTSDASWDTLTVWAKDKDGYKNPVYTDLYVTVSLDGIHEYEVEINPDNAGGMYKNGRKFAGTNTRIRIYQLKATKGTAYDKLQKNSGLYTNYLK